MNKNKILDFLSILRKSKEKNIKKKERYNRYEKAKQEYIDTHMNMAASLHSWKLISIISLAGILVSIIFVFYISSRSTLIPYVIEVDNLGNVKSLNVATQKIYEPKEIDKEYHLREFLKRFRNLSSDVYVVNNNYKINLYFLTNSARRKYDKFLKNEEIVELFKEGFTRQIEILSLNKVVSNSNSYQVRWKEETYAENGELVKEKRYSGIFTLKIEIPNNIEELNSNPLGIRIKDFSIALDN